MVEYFDTPSEAMYQYFDPRVPCRQFDTRACVDLNMDDSKRFRKTPCEPKMCVRFPHRDQ
jgi:hypothetical protein